MLGVRREQHRPEVAIIRRRDGDDIGIGEVGAVFKAFVFEPEDVEVKFVALD